MIFWPKPTLRWTTSGIAPQERQRGKDIDDCKYPRFDGTAALL